ncbi:MAG: hypothetical protein AAGA68_09395 [Pseudomonadota bacterium]
MNRSEGRDETPPTGSIRRATLGLAMVAVLGGAAVVLAQGAQDEPDAEDEDFGAGDFSAKTAQEEESPQRIDLGNSGGGGAITPEQAAEAASPRTDGGDAAGEDGAAEGDNSVFVPTEEIRVDTDIAFPVDI